MLHTRHPVDFVKQPDSTPPHGVPQPLRERGKWPIHYESVESLVPVVDIVTIPAVSVGSGLTYDMGGWEPASYVSTSCGLAILVSALFISLMKMRGMYRPTELIVMPHQVRAVCWAWVTAFLVLAGALFALKIGSTVSRGASILVALVGLVALIGHRRVIAYLLTRGLAEKRFSGRNIVVITDDLSHDENLRRDADSMSQALVDTGFRVKMRFLFPGRNA